MGHHTVTLTVGELSCTYDFEVIESPVASLSADPVTMYEDIDAETYYHHPGASPYVDYTYKYYPCYGTTATAVLKDGTVVRCENSTLTLDGKGYYIEQYDDQERDSEWGVGHHTAHLIVMGVVADYDVEILENPVERFEFEDVTLREGFDGYPAWDYSSDEGYFHYYYEPVCTAYMKDGSVIRSQDRELTVCGREFFIWPKDDQNAPGWEAGEHTFHDTYGVCRVEGKATVVPADIESVVITDADRPLVTVNYNDGSSDEYVMRDFEVYGQYKDGYYGILHTDSLTFEISANCATYRGAFCEYDRDVSLNFGDYTSNTLETFRWMKTEYMRKMLPTYVKAMYLKDGFRGGAAADFPVDGAVSLAVNLLSVDSVNGEYVYESGVGRFNKYKTEDVAASLDYLYGEGTVDLAAYSRYGEEYTYVPEIDQKWYGGDNTAAVIPTGSAVYYTPENEYMDPDAESVYLFNRMDALFDKDGRLTGIYFRTCDVDGDGRITMKDVLKLRAAIAGTEAFTAGQTLRADVDGNGVVNLKDLLLLRKIVAGAA